MPKANITLPNGTTIEIDGTLDEVQKLTEHYGRVAATVKPPKAPARSGAKPKTEAGGEDGEQLNIAQVVGIIKECDEAEVIESKILDQNDMLNRVLMCLWIVHRYVDDSLGLTSGDITKITDQLGTKLAISNASRVLSGKAKALVTGDAVRKKGSAVRYRINRRGIRAFEDILAG